MRDLFCWRPLQLLGLSLSIIASGCKQPEPASTLDDTSESTTTGRDTQISDLYMLGPGANDEKHPMHVARLLDFFTSLNETDDVSLTHGESFVPHHIRIEWIPETRSNQGAPTALTYVVDQSTADAAPATVIHFLRAFKNRFFSPSRFEEVEYVPTVDKLNMFPSLVRSEKFNFLSVDLITPAAKNSAAAASGASPHDNIGACSRLTSEEIEQRSLRTHLYWDPFDYYRKTDCEAKTLLWVKRDELPPAIAMPPDSLFTFRQPPTSYRPTGNSQPESATYAVASGFGVWLGNKTLSADQVAALNLIVLAKLQPGQKGASRLREAVKIRLAKTSISEQEPEPATTDSQATSAATASPAPLRGCWILKSQKYGESFKARLSYSRKSNSSPMIPQFLVIYRNQQGEMFHTVNKEYEDSIIAKYSAEGWFWNVLIYFSKKRHDCTITYRWKTWLEDRKYVVFGGTCGEQDAIPMNECLGH